MTIKYGTTAPESIIIDAFVAWTENHGAEWNLAPMIINGKFSHFMDSDTDTAWIGFFAGWNAYKESTQ